MFTIVYAATRMSERTRHRAAAGGLLCLTTLSFLVCAGSVLAAQISKAGVLLAQPIGASVEGTTVAAALLMMAVTFGLEERTVVKLSTVFTGGVIASFAAVLAGALVAAQRLHPARLLRAEWGRLLPPVAALGGEVWVVNVFLQLLCFAEVVCLVCGRHGPGRPRAVLAAVWMGSVAPLAMATLWTAAAVNMTPRSVSARMADPLEAFLTGSATTAVPVAVMAAFAILTTVIGTALAKRQFITGMIGEPSERGRLLISLGVLGVPSAIALFGGDLFYRAMAFCGGYPALLLYGVAPPWLCWRLRRQDAAAPGRSRVRALLPGGSFALWLLSACGLGVLLTNSGRQYFHFCRFNVEGSRLIVVIRHAAAMTVVAKGDCAREFCLYTGLSPVGSAQRSRPNTRYSDMPCASEHVATLAVPVRSCTRLSARGRLGSASGLRGVQGPLPARRSAT
ncbi:unnamed protein product [Prorocentrum cordatum]|uniref:Uncharacterized protein n=1 Tax=Prorocentrum cordatum TaxID=2364126 RepID=A0ABN9XHH0_9DINO|nr:unnamed protein product [Polarella glacialis]